MELGFDKQEKLHLLMENYFSEMSLKTVKKLSSLNLVNAINCYLGFWKGLWG